MPTFTIRIHKLHHEHSHHCKVQHQDSKLLLTEENYSSIYNERKREN